MACTQQGRSVFGAGALNQVHRLRSVVGIETRGRLISEYERRLARHRPRYGDTLLLADAEFINRSIVLVEAEFGE